MNSIYHGDIKGDNIFLTQLFNNRNNEKAVDFSEEIITDCDTAILLDLESPDLVHYKVNGGTPGHASPIMLNKFRNNIKSSRT